MSITGNPTSMRKAGGIEEILRAFRGASVEDQVAQMKLELMRRAALGDHLFFLESVLDYPPFEGIHREMSDFVDKVVREKRKAIVLIPRGHLKSTVVTVGKTIAWLIKNPDLRILISNASLDNSKGFLREIKTHFERGVKFKKLFGDFSNTDEKWSDSQIIVRPRKKVSKEASIQVTSVDKSVVSQHYDIIIGDDLVNRETISTVDQRDKTALYIKDLYDLLEPGGILILIGTRWHFDDIYGRLMEDDALTETKEYDVLHRTIWKDGDENVPIFSKFTKEHVDSLRRAKGAYEFSCQYLNTPVDNASAEFSREWLQTFDYRDLDDKGYNIYITADPAMEEKSRNDWSGFVVNAVQADRKWYILKAYRRKFNPTKFIEELFALKRQYGDNIKKMGVEKTAFLVGLKPAIEQKEKEYGIRLDIVEVKHERRNKMDRIRALIPYFERGDILLSTNCQDFAEEYLTFPKMKFDDILDAMAYQLDIVEYVGVPLPGQTRAQLRRPIIPRLRKYS